MNKLSVPILLFAVIGITWFLVGNSEENANFTEFSYVTKDATKGDISNTISATGTLAAVDDVIIGAQLSGKITDVFVDFNDKVDAGQLLAQIDSRSFQARVDQAAAQVDKTKAEIKIQKIAIARSQLTAQRAERDYQRGLTVSKEKFISENELDQLKTAAATSTLDYENQQAQLESLQATLAANKASLKQSEIDLNHTQIISPIDGFIINRTIEPGQTVASSLNTPELFTVAKNLSEMEIEAYIDESDIGPVEEGQTVSFSVDAFPERKLRGRVKQIRQAPQTNSGVISYTVIIATHNPANMLLPGMTANLEINIDAVRDVQRIDNAALRVASKLSSSSSKESEKPKRRGMMAQMEALNLTDEQKAKIREAMPKRSANTTGGFRGGNGNNQMRQKIQSLMQEILTPEQRKLRDDLVSGKIKQGQLMVLQQGSPEVINVQLGISDSQYTQVLTPDLSGMNIITQVKASKER